jgi:hypothetical protein
VASQQRINPVIVLMLEDRAFDHRFGIFKPKADRKFENLTGPNSRLSNLLAPGASQSGNNPRLTVSTPALFALHDQEGPSHSFSFVSLQPGKDRLGPSSPHPVNSNGFVRSDKDNLLQRTG